jgi:hypothetical protein
MFKKILQKTVSVLVLLLAAWVIYADFLPGKSPTPAARGPLTLAQSKAMHLDLGGKAEDPPLVLFVTSWCGVCRVLEGQLTKLSVPYVRADIDNNRKALLYYQGVTRGSGGAVPVTVVGDKVFVGLQTQAILRELVSLVEGHTSGPEENQQI